jgi:hypothetical protein
MGSPPKENPLKKTLAFQTWFGLSLTTPPKERVKAMEVPVPD